MPIITIILLILSILLNNGGLGITALISYQAGY
jgi:hypothetical protein